MLLSVPHTRRVIRLAGEINRQGIRRFVSKWKEEETIIRPRAQEDPTITYDLHAAFSKDPESINMEDAYDPYTKIHRAAVRAGKRPPRKKKVQFDAVGNRIGIRYTDMSIPRRIRTRLIEEGNAKDPQFYVSRFGLNKELVKRIRLAFRQFETVRIEVGSPWKDNPVKFAERIELRTGCQVLDRAGCRLLLYRGFTHADLARKGLTDSVCFAEEPEVTFPTDDSPGPSGNRPPPQVARGTRRRADVSQHTHESSSADSIKEGLESGRNGEEWKQFFQENPDAEKIFKMMEDSEGEDEEDDESIREMITSIQYRAAKLKGSKHGVDPSLFTGEEFMNSV